MRWVAISVALWTLVCTTRVHAQCANEACVTTSARLASVSTAQSALLDALLSSLLGPSVDLSVLDHTALATTSIRLDRLIAALNAAGIGNDASTALSTSVSWSTLLGAVAATATVEGDVPAAAVLNALAMQTASIATSTIQLNGLIDADLRPGPLTNTEVNLLDLVTGSASLFNARNVAAVRNVRLQGSAVGLGTLVNTVDVAFVVVEPARFVCGPQGTQFYSAALRLRARVVLLDPNEPLSILGLASVSLHLVSLDLIAALARASGTLDTINAAAGTVTVSATPGVAELYLGTVSDMSFLDRSTPIDPATELFPAVIARLDARVGLATASAQVSARSSVLGTTPTARQLNFTAPYPRTLTASTQTGFLGTLISRLLANTEIQVSVFQPSLGLGQLLIDLVLSIVSSTLQTVGGLLGGTLTELSNAILDPLLGLLGVRIGEVAVTVDRAYAVASGETCNDNAFCTEIDTCNASSVCTGTPRTCSDGLSCTTDMCNETQDLCVNTLSTGCNIGGACVASGALDPSNDCRACSPATSTSGYSNRASGTACSDGAFCTENDSCNGLGVCVATPRDCGDGLLCTGELCDEQLDRCVNAITVGCVIGGACVLPGADDPSSACRSCNPLLSTTAYSNKPAGASCADGLFCTVDDACDGAGACTSAPRTCDDGLPCTGNACDEASDSCVNDVSAGCLIDGACQLVGAEQPSNPCRQCNPLVSATSWSDKPAGVGCSDGLFCTDGESCNGAGACIGVPHICDPGSSGCNSVCDETQDSCRTDIVGCLIGQACLAAGTDDPANPCHVCNPVLSNTSWSNKALGTSCSDGQYCTDNDVCNGLGLCAGLPRLCTDGKVCTIDDCDEDSDSCSTALTVGCLIDNACILPLVEEPGNPCRQCNPALSTTGWSDKPAGTLCSDDKYCTTGDSCDGEGACGGAPLDCGQGGGCSSVCDETENRCRTDIAGCLIDGVCYAEGADHPTNPCRSCDPARSVTSFSNRTPGTSCSDGLFCTTGDVCSLVGTCVGAPLDCSQGNGGCTSTCDEESDQCRSGTGGCLIDGVCLAAGTIDPTNACLVCNPAASLVAFTPRPVGSSCSDGLFCTRDDACTSLGACVGSTNTCGDGLACTLDFCDEVFDRCTATISVGCLIEGVCQAPGADDPSNACKSCNPLVSVSAFSAKSVGVSCDDGLFCTDNDGCDGAGGCLGQLSNCGAGLACTSFCDEQANVCRPDVTGCSIGNSCVAAFTVDPDSHCRICDPTVATRGWTDLPAGTSCADSLFCTVDEVCDGQGQCEMSLRDCGDMLSCTIDACNELSNSCDHLGIASCVIDGACVPAGATDPGNSCRVCDPLRAQTGWSNALVALPCDDGINCTTLDACNGAGACVGTPRTCNDGLDCTTDSCDEASGSCSNLLSGGCTIAGACLPSGSVDPTNGCRTCNPSVSTTSWTNSPAGTSCSDGAFCTDGDSCDGAGACLTTVRDCSDGLLCTLDLCDELLDRCVNDITLGCAIGGACIALGAEDPSNACRLCNPLVSTTTYSNKPSGASCSDGLYCTVGDSCDGAGACASLPRTCDDGLGCTSNACDEGSDGCVHEISTGCRIDGACVPAGSEQPGNPCRQCNPLISDSAWSDKPSGVSCDDGLFCTDGEACNGLGACIGAPHVCDPGSSGCNSVCDETLNSCRTDIVGCLIGQACLAAGTEDPTNPCHVCNPTVSNTSWSNKAIGTSCSDGQYCTDNDVCNGLGACIGPARNCNDGRLCTLDSCDESADRCHTSLTVGCLIDGACVLPLADEPGNPCRVCNPLVSTSGWSDKPAGTSCSDELFCTSGDACDGEGACAGAPLDCGQGGGCSSVCDETENRCRTDIAGCLIDAVCYAEGTDHPSNPCRSCDPNRSVTGWSNKAPGTSCSDGLFCTTGDVCDPTGTCSGAPLDCSQGEGGCTSTCDEANDQCQAGSGGCLINNICLAAGTVDSANSCLVCNPAASLIAFTPRPVGASCSDGLFCTSGDACTALGVCVGADATCNDGLSCTLDLCDELADRCSVDVDVGCLIDGVCRAAGVDDPGNGCMSCNPLVSPTSWSAKSVAVSCSDGLFCTDGDGCDGAGNCVGQLSRCGAGLSCSSFCDEQADSCRADVNGCSIGNSCVAAGTIDPDSPCRHCDPSLASGAWSNRPAGSSCADSLFCTVSELCDADGQCQTNLRDCTDPLACTFDGCNEASNSCDHLAVASCVIDGACVPAGATQPGNACRVCDPLRAPDAWSSALEAAPCDDGVNCTALDACNASGVCMGTPRACNDGLDCTTDACEESSGTCSNALSTGCNIGGVCVAAGTVDPSSGCRACNPSTSTTSWTNRPAGTSCSDGAFCTEGDSCNGAGGCITSVRDCDDGLPCTLDACDELLDRCVNDINLGCLIGGLCVVSGSNDPSSACRSCNPLLSATTYSNKPAGANCADGLYCTVDDACDGAGSCASTPRGCDDGLPCTGNACDEARDSCSNDVSAGCVIDGACHAAGADEPGNLCRHCDPLLSTTSWSDKPSGIACDDGLFCTDSETCNGQGACIGAPRVCDPGGAGCTSVCDEAQDRCRTDMIGCLIGQACLAAGAQDPTNPCHVCNPVLSVLSWSNRLLGTDCSDGLFCTEGDSCDSNGVCSGTRRVCDDGRSCTIDRCDESANRCSEELAEGCLIDDSCVPALAEAPDGSCRICNPALSTSSWSDKPVGTPCSDDLFCTTGDTCNGEGACSGAPLDCGQGGGCASVCDETSDSCRTDVAGCLIDGLCHAEGSDDPSNPCRTCAPATSASSWTHKAAGTPCDDGLFCSTGDACSAGGECQGAPLDCTQGAGGCTSTCDEQRDQCEVGIGGCLIGGACLAPGSQDPENSCLVCNPAVSLVTFTSKSVGESCDDGLFCTSGDACTSLGVCVGSTATCSDGQACTLDLCDELASRCTVDVNVGCLIDGVCRAAGSDDPSNVCMSCNPLVSTSSWSAKSVGVSCSDGLFCTDNDGCDGTGTCVGQLSRCGTGLACSSFCDEQADACRSDVTGCSIGNSCVAAGTLDPEYPCRACDPSVATTSWTNRPLGARCADDSYCTVDELCDGAGRCNVSMRDCADPLECTTDACNELTDSCVHATALSCVIDGACVAAGAAQAGNACHICDPARAVDAWSDALSDTICDDSLYCTVLDRCDASGICAGTSRTCTDNLGCTTDRCDEALGACTNTLREGCSIGGACVPEGSIDPSNDCRTCNPALSTSAWSNLPAGTSCSDGAFCSAGDSCNGFGTCIAAPRDCSDGLPCTSDACDELLDRCVYDVGLGCVIDGACVAPGSDDPSSACRTCNPALSSTSYSNKPAGASCADGLFCTTSDACDGAGTCASEARSCEDGLGCTANACDEASDSCIIEISTGCLLDGACVAAGGDQPGNPCRHCNPALSTSSWSDKPSGVTCSDGLFCTSGESCNGSGACIGVPRVCDPSGAGCASVCDEVQDRCRTDIVGCLIGQACLAAGTDDPANPCRSCDPAISTVAWSNKTAGTTCNDGLFCTENDRCSAAGLCSGSTQRCDDGLGCTSEQCNESADRCEPEVQAGCVIDGACVVAFAEEPGNSCRSCNPALSTSGWSDKPAGVSCSDGLFCTASDRCDGEGACVGSALACGGEGCESVCDENEDRCRSDIAGCLVDGICHAEGSDDPSNGCRTCDPSLSTTTFSNKLAGESCSDELFCTTNDSCDGAGRCSGDVRDCGQGNGCTSVCDEARDLCATGAGGCLIAGVCIASGAEDPSNPCAFCNPAVSSTAYSPRPIGANCTDGLFCTQDDRCDGAGVCIGVTQPCSDELACTRDVCDESSDRCASTIDSGCVIDGVCRRAGEDDPSNPCRSCNPLVSSSSWTAKPLAVSCSDGLFCTEGDGCDGQGVCAGRLTRCGSVRGCGSFCDEQSDQCRSDVAGCSIAGACVAQGTLQPQAACRSCDPSVSTTQWSDRAAGSSCADDAFCTVDERCDGRGACISARRDCSDNLPCTSDTCNETTDACEVSAAHGCVIGQLCLAAGAVSADSPCLVCDPARSSTSWSAALAGVACDDGLFCTGQDRCDGAGRCDGTGITCPNDQLDCTAELCDEANDVCRSELATGCLIANTCVADGQRSPSDPCLVCRAALSTSSYSYDSRAGGCDSDGDGLRDDDERNSEGDVDSDGDRIPNHLDPDDDNDSILTADENADPNRDGAPEDARDLDQDGRPDYLDPDDDDDSILTLRERADADEFGADVDVDLSPNWYDTDSDGDGGSDAAENEGDGDIDDDDVPDYLELDTTPPDDDHDGLSNRQECPDGDAVCDDTDEDGLPNWNDPDDDNDTIWTRHELRMQRPYDSDGDGAPDHLDADDDDDRLPTRIEAPDPNMDGSPVDARDFDRDRTADYVDVDDDGDNIPTRVEVSDAITYSDERDVDVNPSWWNTDSDGDGVLDSDEPFDDNFNSIPDYLEPFPIATDELDDAGLRPAAPNDSTVAPSADDASPPDFPEAGDRARAGGIAGGALCSLRRDAADGPVLLWLLACTGGLLWRRRLR